MSDELYLEYNATIGSVMLARKLYTDSWAAEQAQKYLTREIEHRDEVRGRYDAAARGRPPGERDG